jgi:S-methylmethionine-dependent homocysteine/selenocysteine methylase
MREGITILDGAVGTELSRRGLSAEGPLFSAAALLDEPGRALLRRVHLDYLTAGAQVITAASFRTNPRALSRQGLASRFPELARAAVDLARAARDEAGTGALVAGSLAPVEDCYRPELRPPADEALAEHRLHARALAEAGCDIFIIETVAAADEGLAALRAALETGLPAWVSAQCSPLGTLLDGSPLRSFFLDAARAGAGALLINCTPPDGIDGALAAAAAPGVPFGAYAQLGAIDPASGWQGSAPLSAQEYAERAAAWAARGARVLGGCCGTTPAHIEALRGAVRAPLRE